MTPKKRHYWVEAASYFFSQKISSCVLLTRLGVVTTTFENWKKLAQQFRTQYCFRLPAIHTAPKIHGKASFSDLKNALSAAARQACLHFQYHSKSGFFLPCLVWDAFVCVTTTRVIQKFTEELPNGIDRHQLSQFPAVLILFEIKRDNSGGVRKNRSGVLAASIVTLHRTNRGGG